MTEIGFYQLLTTPLEAALPKLLEKVYAQKLRALVLAASPERVAALSAVLWTYNPARFLPHGSADDGFAAEQPIYLTHIDENPNQASVLFLTDNVVSVDLNRFDRCVDLFDGRDEQALDAARDRYRVARAAGYNVKYYRQTETGWREDP